MKKSRFGKMMMLVLAVVMVFAFTTTAFADTYYNKSISASSSTSSVRLSGVTISHSRWSGNGTFYGSARLTVRPYSGSTRLSLAKTFSSSVTSGGQYYDLLAYPVQVKANSSTNGVYVRLKGTWKF